MSKFTASTCPGRWARARGRLRGASAVSLMAFVLMSALPAMAREHASDGRAPSNRSQSDMSPSDRGADLPRPVRNATPDDLPAVSGDEQALTESGLRRMLYAAAETAVDLSPQVSQMYAEYQAAQADVDQAKGARWPQLQLSGQTRSMQFGPNAGLAYDAGNALGVNLTTTLFDWGRNSKTIGSREQLATANQLRYVVQMENSAYQVTDTLVELAKQRNIERLSQQFVDRMTQLVGMLEEIVAIDRGRGSELTQAKARLLQAQASRDTAVAKARDAELNLRKLIGDQPVAIPLKSAWPLRPDNLEHLLSELDEHPRIQQARAEASAADLNRDAVRASAKPQLNWVVSSNTGRDALGRKMPWQTMLTLNWNAFTGGAANAATNAATYRALARWRDAEQTRLDLEYQVRTADHDAHTSLERADQYRDLTQESDRVRKAFFDQWYHLGKRSLLDVLIAESDHYSNRVSEVAYRFDGYAATIRSHASAGALVRWLREG